MQQVAAPFDVSLVCSIIGDKAFMGPARTSPQGSRGCLRPCGRKIFRAGDIREDDRQTRDLKYEPAGSGACHAARGSDGWLQAPAHPLAAATGLL